MQLEQLISTLKEKGKNKKIIYCNIADIRILKACEILLGEGHKPILCGKKEELKLYKKIINYIEFYDSKDEDSNIFGAKLLAEGKVDGLISGNLDPTANVVRALIKNVGTKNIINKISGYFLMNTNKGLYLMGDCAIQVNPNKEELAEIAYLSAISAIKYGIKPKIAMLSFSTNGSAKHDDVDTVKEATVIARTMLKNNNIDAIIEGEIQLDAAIIEDISIKKNPKSILKGTANVLIFPNLSSGNIGYKLIQNFGNATAIGPIIQGLNKPGNDLSRGCSVEDIVKLHYITANS